MEAVEPKEAEAMAVEAALAELEGEGRGDWETVKVPPLQFEPVGEVLPRALGEVREEAVAGTGVAVELALARAKVGVTVAVGVGKGVDNKEPEDEALPALTVALGGGSAETVRELPGVCVAEMLGVTLGEAVALLLPLELDCGLGERSAEAEKWGEAEEERVEKLREAERVRALDCVVEAVGVAVGLVPGVPVPSCGDAVAGGDEVTAASVEETLGECPVVPVAPSTRVGDTVRVAKGGVALEVEDAQTVKVPGRERVPWGVGTAVPLPKGTDVSLGGPGLAVGENVDKSPVEVGDIVPAV